MFSAEIMKNFMIGLQITLYGLGGVFAVLVFFYLILKLMMKVAGRFPGKHDNSD